MLFLLTVFTISRVHLHYPVVAKMRPLLLISILAFGYAYLNPKQLTHTNVLRFWPMRTVLVLAVLACCSAVFGISLGGSAHFILDSYSKTVAYAFLIALTVRNARDLYTYVWAFVISCGILAIMSIFVFDLSTDGSYTARLGELYTYDSNDLGVILMIGLPLNLLLLFVDRGLKRWALLLNLVGIAAAMARSGSRGGFLGLLAVGLAALFLVNGVAASRRFTLLFATIIALAVAAPEGYWKQMETILNPEKDYNVTSIDGRTALIKRGLEYMWSYPIFGLGIWNFAQAECTISPKVATRRFNGPLRCTAPHNSFVQAGAELGAVGFVVWMSLLLRLVIAPLRLRKRLPKVWLRGPPVERFLYASATFFPIAMIGFSVTAFFVSFAFADPIYVLAAFMTGLLIAVRAEIEQRRLADGYAPVVAAGSPGWRVRRQTERLPMLEPRLLTAET